MRARVERGGNEHELKKIRKKLQTKIDRKHAPDSCLNKILRSKKNSLKFQTV